RKAPKSPVTDLVTNFVPGSGFQMVRRDPGDLGADIVAVDRLDAQAVQKRERRWNAELLVIHRPNPPLDHRRRRRFAEVVTDGAEHHRDLHGAREPVEPGSSLIDYLQRVRPDVALGMPVGLLRASNERAELRKELVEHAEVSRDGQANRWSGREE